MPTVVLTMPRKFYDNHVLFKKLEEMIEYELNLDLVVIFSYHSVRPTFICTDEDVLVSDQSLLESVEECLTDFFRFPVTLPDLRRSIPTRGNGIEIIGGGDIKIVGVKAWGNKGAGISAQDTCNLEIAESSFYRNGSSAIRAIVGNRANLTANFSGGNNMNDEKADVEIKAGTLSIKDHLYVGDRPGLKAEVEGDAELSNYVSLPSDATPELLLAVKNLRLSIEKIPDPRVRAKGEFLLSDFEAARKDRDSGVPELLTLREWAINASAVITTVAILYSFVAAIAKAVGVELPPAPPGLGQ